MKVVRIPVFITLVAATVLSLALCLPQAANATVLERLTLAQLSQRATSIVVARTASVGVKTTSISVSGRQANLINTVAGLSVTSVLKGHVPSSVAVSVLGGRFGTVDARVDGMPEFAPGETCLVFLDAQNRVIGGIQGKLVVENGMVEELGKSLATVRGEVMNALSGSPSSTVSSAYLGSSGVGSTDSSVTIQGTPVITSISPGSSSAGTGGQVTVTGSGFGSSPGSVGSVNFFFASGQPTIPGNILSWSDTSIVVQVPVGTVLLTSGSLYSGSAGSGPVTVTNSSGAVSAGYDFSVTFGYGLKEWSTPAATFYVNANCADTTAEKSLVDAAANTWNAVSKFKFTDAGASSATTFDYLHNDVFWSSSLLPTGVIAATCPYNYTAYPTELAAVDLCFNDYYTWGDGSNGTMDVQSIALHELGHWLVLTDLYGPGDTSKVMYGYRSPGQVTRTLTDSERQGIIWIYGPVGPPSVTSVSPASGSLLGGSSVVIRGTNFAGLSGASAVTFGGVNAKSYTVNSQTQITAVAPAHALGAVQVRVTSAYGSSTDTAADDFTYTLARAEQNNTNLSYNGTWATYPNTYFSGGTHAYTKTAGSSVTVAFTGSRFDWIGLAGAQYGIASVSVDGGPSQTVDLYNSTNQFKKTLFSKSDFTAGLHTVTITCTGTKNPSATDSYISVDAFDTDGALTLVSTVQQNDSRLVYGGSWLSYANTPFSGGSYAYTQTAGATVTIPFNGRELHWIATKGPVYGIAQVSVDGGSSTPVDLWADSYQYRQDVYATPVLANGLHTLTITYTGDKNASATGTYVNADAFLVVGSAAPSTRFEQTATQLLWTGTWSLGSSTYCSGGSQRYTNRSGTSVTVNFTGASLSLVATKAACMGKMSISLDGGTATLVDLYAAATYYKQKVYSTGILKPGNHTVTISWTGDKSTAATGNYVDIDAVDVIGSLR